MHILMGTMVIWKGKRPSALYAWKYAWKWCTRIMNVSLLHHLEPVVLTNEPFWKPSADSER